MSPPRPSWRDDRVIKHAYWHAAADRHEGRRQAPDRHVGRERHRSTRGSVPRGSDRDNDSKQPGPDRDNDSKRPCPDRDNDSKRHCPDRDSDSKRQVSWQGSRRIAPIDTFRDKAAQPRTEASDRHEGRKPAQIDTRVGCHGPDRDEDSKRPSVLAGLPEDSPYRHGPR